MHFDEFHIDLDTVEEVEEMGPVVRIEVREISENRIEVLGWCEDYPDLRPKLEDLRREISELFVLVRKRSMTSQLGNGDSSYELSDLQKAIIEACEQLNEQREPWEPIKDDAVSAKLSSMGILNPKGNAYTRDWIGKKRRELQERGYDVGKKGK